MSALDNDLFAVDRTFSLWLHAFGKPWLDRVMITVTHAGDSLTLWLVVAVCGVFFYLQDRRWREYLALPIAYGMSALLSVILKLGFQRERPRLWVMISQPTDFSFPSSHAMGALTVYGLTAFLLVQIYPRQRVALWLLSGTLIGVIGLSRIYLGVHWPTDVLAGFAVGCILVYLGVRWYRSARPGAKVIG